MIAFSLFPLMTQMLNGLNYFGYLNHHLFSCFVIRNLFKNNPYFVIVAYFCRNSRSKIRFNRLWHNLQLIWMCKHVFCITWCMGWEAVHRKYSLLRGLGTKGLPLFIINTPRAGVCPHPDSLDLDTIWVDMFYHVANFLYCIFWRLLNLKLM